LADLRTRNDSGQAVHTIMRRRAPVIKRYNLVNERWRSETGKVTVGQESHWQALQISMV